LVIVEISWDSDNGVFDGGTEMGFSDFFHFTENKRGNLFGVEFLLFAFVFDDNDRFVTVTGLNFERPKFDVFLDSWFGELSSD